MGAQMGTRATTKKDRNAEVVTLKLQRNELRLLEAAIMDRKIMVAADRGEGRITVTECVERINALTDLEKKIAGAIR